MTITPQDLKGTYHWPGDQEELLGKPTRRTFDRWNGRQILLILNEYAQTADNFTREDIAKIEDLLISQLPLSPCSEISVINWLKQEAP